MRYEANRRLEVASNDFSKAEKMGPAVAITSADSPKSPQFYSPKGGAKTPGHAHVHSMIDTAALIDANIPEPLHSLDDIDVKFEQ